MEFNRTKFHTEAKQLQKLFSEDWLFTNHFRAVQKSDEFWYKYNKIYDDMNDIEQDIFNTIVFESTYREKYLTEKEKIRHEKWLDNLIPDDYWQTK